MVTALHIYPSTFTHESRILKETGSLVNSGLIDRIFIRALWVDGLAEFEHLDDRRELRRIPLLSNKFLGISGKLIRFAEWYIKIFIEFRSKKPTFINCHSLSVLPLGVLFYLIYGSRVIYDTHELETETAESKGLRRIIARLLERLLIGYVESVIVVSESIGIWYKKFYKLNNVYVVRNIPHSRPTNLPKSTFLRHKFGLIENDKLFILQGVLDHGRGIDIVLKAFTQISVDNHIIFLGNGPLQHKIINLSVLHKNIHHHPAVSFDELLSITSCADIGITLIENVCLSYFYCLPNKLFEYIISGLPVIVSDFPEMAKIIDQNRCGWKTDVNSESLIRLISNINIEDIREKTYYALKSSSNFGWHIEEKILLSIYFNLLNIHY
jgi:glycosyltransferase involved in cell wall biosynthesis